MHNGFKHRSSHISHSLNSPRWVLLLGRRVLFYEAIHRIELLKDVPSLSHCFQSCLGHMPFQPSRWVKGIEKLMWEFSVGKACQSSLLFIHHFCSLVRSFTHVATLNCTRLLGNIIWPSPGGRRNRCSWTAGSLFHISCYYSALMLTQLL